MKQDIFFSIPNTTIMNIKQSSIHLKLIITHIGLKVGMTKLTILILLFLV